MVKVKLRVPLSSAPREAASSPLANPLRSAPDYSDDEEPTTPRRDGATPDDTADLDNSDAEELEDDEDEDPEADELDELDELEGDDDASSKPADASAKRRSITLKRPSKSGPNSSASPSAEGSTSPHLGAKVVKRSSLARTAQLQAMSVEELDALPAAKRRKTAKARGAAGPGRGWRKGLTKGQKPVYELPASERTPATFGNTANARSSPVAPTAVKAETPTPILPKPRPISIAAVGESSRPSTSAPHRSSAPSGASVPVSSIKIISGPGGQTFTGDLNAKAGTAKNPGFRYPPLPSSRAGPPVQPIARIPTAFQVVIPLERNERQPRRWLRAKREVLSMGGRPWSIPVFYGGEDRGYEKKADAPAPTATGTTAAGGAEKVVAKASTPSAVLPTTSAPAPAAAAATTTKTVSPAPSTPTPTAQGTATTTTSLPKPTGGAGSSPLPPPKHLNGLQAETNWRGQSPAFLFGGR